MFEGKRSGNTWELIDRKHPYEFHCIALDHKKEGRLYAASFDDGLIMSDDYGRTLRPVGEGITHKCVLSLAVSEGIDGGNII